MEIKISGQHVDVTPALKDRVEKKATKLNRHVDKIMWVNVVLKIEKNNHIAEATMHIKGHDFFAQSSTDSMYSSIDAVMNRLDAQALKYKDKKTSK